jgi:hypothetical protein
VHECGNFETLQRNLLSAVDGVGVTEERARETYSVRAPEVLTIQLGTGSRGAREPASSRAIR